MTSFDSQHQHAASALGPHELVSCEHLDELGVSDVAAPVGVEELLELAHLVGVLLVISYKLYRLRAVAYDLQVKSCRLQGTRYKSQATRHTSLAHLVWVLGQVEHVKEPLDLLEADKAVVAHVHPVEGLAEAREPAMNE